MADRAVSAVVNYVLVLGIVTLLGTGLFMAASDHVQDQQSAVIRSSFHDVGNDLAGELSDAERVARAADGDGRVEISADLPERVAGSSYRITIHRTAPERGTIVLTSDEPAVSVSVPFRSGAPVTEGTVAGGPVVIRAEVTDGAVTHVEVDDD